MKSRPSPPPPDCLTCGACCVSPFPGVGYIHLGGEEEESRMRLLGLPVVEIMQEEDGERMVLLGTRVNAQGHRVCRALQGKVGRRVACDIYEGRPSLCRQFEAGSPECFQARKAVGMG